MNGAMGVVAVLGGVAQLASIGSAFWLGGRLLRKALRTGQEPERLLGLHLVLSMGVGSLFLSISSLTNVSEVAMPPALYGSLTVAGNVCSMLGLMAALWFNYRVFHGAQRSGLVVAVTASALMVLGFLLYVGSGGLVSDELYGRASWPYIGAMALGDAWVISDSLRFRGQLLRRLALGLAEPLVVDRLLLWALASLARVGLVLIAPLLTALLPTNAARAAVSPAFLLVTALMILGATVSLWLMLSPTERYRRWVHARYAAAPH